VGDGASVQGATVGAIGCQRLFVRQARHHALTAHPSLGFANGAHLRALNARLTSLGKMYRGGSLMPLMLREEGIAPFEVTARDVALFVEEAIKPNGRS
jgi:hypothetical protein